MLKGADKSLGMLGGAAWATACLGVGVFLHSARLEYAMFTHLGIFESPHTSQAKEMWKWIDSPIDIAVRERSKVEHRANAKTTLREIKTEIDQLRTEINGDKVGL